MTPTDLEFVVNKYRQKYGTKAAYLGNTQFDLNAGSNWNPIP